MSLRYFSNFLRTIKMPLINCEVNFFLTWSEKCIIVSGNYGNWEPKWAITDTRLYVPVVTLSAQNNKKLLHRLKTAFKKTINWNKYQSEPTLQTLKRYSNHLIDPSFQRLKIFLVSSFENDAYLRSYKQYFPPTVEIKDDKVMIDKSNIFDRPIKNDSITNGSVQNTVTGQGDYKFLKNYYIMIAMDLSKQQDIDADPRAIQQINFTANLDREG